LLCTSSTNCFARSRTGSTKSAWPPANGGARHRRIFRLVGILDQDDAAGLLDSLHPDGAVGARSGEDDGKPVAVLVRQRAKELVDRCALSARFLELGDRDIAVGDEEAAVGRNDVDMVRPEGNPMLDLFDGHAGARRKEAGEVAVAVRIEMHDHGDRGAHLLGKGLEKRLQRFHAAGRGSDPGNGKRWLLAFGRILFDFCALLHGALPRKMLAQQA